MIIVPRSLESLGYLYYFGCLFSYLCQDVQQSCHGKYCGCDVVCADRRYEVFNSKIITQKILYLFGIARQAELVHAVQQAVLVREFARCVFRLFL
ncbi:MAG: hypothetical protein AMJ75_04505 [Phycisphaerae bacterium SM1_79]|nr:MAG: hypothetical protein AMJ75_04505 [Phycisphaerae bacterium SM1_79]